MVEVSQGEETKEDYSRIRTFGCTAVVLDENRLKDWRPKGIEGLMVGYTQGSTSYRIWVPILSKELNSANVRFDETAPSQLQGGITEGAQTTPVAASNLQEYEYLKDTVHTDPEDLMIYKVTDVRVSEG